MPLETVRVRAVTFFFEDRAGNPKCGIGRKFANEKFEVVGFKGDVSIQVSNDVIRKIFQFLESRIERTNLCSEAAVPPLWQLHKFNPWILVQITTHYGGCRIERSVVNNHPLQR